MKNNRGQSSIVLVLITFFVIAMYVTQSDKLHRQIFGSRVEANDYLVASDLMESIATTLRTSRDLAASGACGAGTTIGTTTYCLPTEDVEGSAGCMRDPLNNSRLLCISPTDATTQEIDFVFWDWLPKIKFGWMQEAFAQTNMDPIIPAINSPPSVTYSVSTLLTPPASAFHQDCNVDLHCVTIKLCLARNCDVSNSRIFYQTVGFPR